MYNSDVTSFSSPYDFLQKYIPRESEKALRNSFIQAVALLSLGIILLGLYYVYSILEPFCLPLFWAFLTGLVLHPYKKSVTDSLRLSLESLVGSKQTMFVALLLASLHQLDQGVDYAGTQLTRRWKVLLAAAVVISAIYLVSYFWPSALQVLLSALQAVLLIDFSTLFSSVSLHHVLASALLSLITIAFGRPEYRLFYQTTSLVTWILLGSYFMNFLWSPLVQAMFVAWVYGFCTLKDSGDEPDGLQGQVRSVFLSFLHKLNLLPGEAEDVADIAKPDPCLNSPLIEGANPRESTPKVTLCPPEGGSKTKAPLESTPKVAVIPHPGVSAIKKEHGVGIKGKDRPDVSGIEKVAHHSQSALGGNTPRSRGMSTGHASHLRASFRPMKRSNSTIGDLPAIQSMTYIYGALWACLLVQLWLRPFLLHLLPLPFCYHLIKVVGRNTGLSQFLGQQVSSAGAALLAWLEERSELLLPAPVLTSIRIGLMLERKLLHAVLTNLDTIVTGLLLLAIVLGVAFTSIFMFFQVYSETVYVAQSLGTLASSLNMSDSYILNTINSSLTDTGYDSMESVVEQVHNYGRAWVSDTLQQSLAESEPQVRQDLSRKVLELWDRSYHYWVLREQELAAVPVGPTVSGEAISSSVSEVLHSLYSSPNLLNLGSLQTFLANNMGTLTSIMEQVWAIVKGNLGLLSDSVLGLARVVLHGGSGVLNFLFGLLIYLTGLFYLLSQRSPSYRPLSLLSQLSLFQVEEVGASLQKAVNSVFLITVKMAAFYFLWTYLTHVLFQASIVVLPILFSSFIAACPFTGQQVVALPAALELWLLQERPVAAVALVLVQLLPSWVVDTSIYSEIKGGIHPWFTGLAVVGGVYMFGVLGAIYGPLVLCVLYVALTVYSNLLADTEPNLEHTQQASLRPAFLRSGTVI